MPRDRLAGRVALITGAARGQGRAHAVTMAREGAKIIAVDICRQVPGVPYPMASSEDLAETVRQVEELSGDVMAVECDCRDGAAIRAVVDDGVERFGGLDIAVVNHGILAHGGWDDASDDMFDLVLETNLNSAWRVARAVVPHLIGRGSGSLLFTASVVALRPVGGVPAYSASKAGLVALAKSLAVKLGPHNIRVNSLCPGTVATPMVHNQYMMDLFNGGPGGTLETMEPVMQATHLLPIPSMDPQVVADAAVFLASDAGRYITGTALPLDAGTLAVPAGIPSQTAAELGSLRAKLRAAGVD